MAAPTDPSDWHFKPLRELDALLRCSICFEYYQTPIVMPNCSHIYCSVCIRRYLAVNKQCPTCSAGATDSGLRANRKLEEIVCTFTMYRHDYMKLVSMVTSRNGTTQHQKSSAHIEHESHEHIGESHDPNCVPAAPNFSQIDDVNFSEENDALLPLRADQEQPITPKHHQSQHATGNRAPSVSTKQSTSGVRLTKKKSANGLVSPSLPSLSHRLAGFDSPSTTHGRMPSASFNPLASVSCTPSRAGSVLSPSSLYSSSVAKTTPNSGVVKDKTTPTVTPTTSNTKVACPVCGLEVFEKVINVHLDLCLRKPSPSSSSSSSSSLATSQPKGSGQLPRLPKLCPDIMKPQQLRAKLKEYHLPTHGSRQALMTRLKEYHLQYNAQRDSYNPKSVMEIARDVEQAERLKQGVGPGGRGRGPVSSAPPTVAPVRRSNMTEAELEKQRKGYEEHHSSQFASLLEQAKAREKALDRQHMSHCLRDDTPSFLPLEPQVTVVEAGSENFAERDISKGKYPSSGPKHSSMMSSNKWKSPTSTGVTSSFKGKSPTFTGVTSSYRGKSPTSSGRQSTSSGGNSPTLSNTEASGRGKSPKLQPRGRGKSPTLLEVEADISSQIDALFGDCEVLAEDSQEDDAIPQTSRLLSAPSPAAVALETCSSVPDSPRARGRSKRRKHLKTPHTSSTPHTSFTPHTSSSTPHRSWGGHGEEEDPDFEAPLSSSYPARKRQRRC